MTKTKTDNQGKKKLSLQGWTVKSDDGYLFRSLFGTELEYVRDKAKNAGVDLRRYRVVPAELREL